MRRIFRRGVNSVCLKEKRNTMLIDIIDLRSEKKIDPSRFPLSNDHTLNSLIDNNIGEKNWTRRAPKH